MHEKVYQTLLEERGPTVSLSHTPSPPPPAPAHNKRAKHPGEVENAQHQGQEAQVQAGSDAHSLACWASLSCALSLIVNGRSALEAQR